MFYFGKVVEVKEEISTRGLRSRTLNIRLSQSLEERTVGADVIYIRIPDLKSAFKLGDEVEIEIAFPVPPAEV